MAVAVLAKEDSLVMVAISTTSAAVRQGFAEPRAGTAALDGK